MYAVVILLVYAFVLRSIRCLQRRLRSKTGDEIGECVGGCFAIVCLCVERDRLGVYIGFCIGGLDMFYGVVELAFYYLVCFESREGWR